MMTSPTDPAKLRVFGCASENIARTETAFADSAGKHGGLSGERRSCRQAVDYRRRVLRPVRGRWTALRCH